MVVVLVTNSMMMVLTTLCLENGTHACACAISVIECLKNAHQLGTVIIITNAESGWVEVRIRTTERNERNKPATKSYGGWL